MGETELSHAQMEHIKRTSVALDKLGDMLVGERNRYREQAKTDRISWILAYHYQEIYLRFITATAGLEPRKF